MGHATCVLSVLGHQIYSCLLVYCPHKCDGISCAHNDLNWTTPCQLCIMNVSMDQGRDLGEVVSSLQSLVARLSVSREPILPVSIPALPETARRLPESAQSEPLAAVAKHLETYITPYLNLSSLSPNYYGFVTGGATPAALLADWVASVYDQNVHVHLPQETIATSVEVTTLNLLLDLFRLPAPEWSVGGSGNGGATFTTGATASNVLGLALGREFVLRRAVQRRTGSTNDSQTSCGECGIGELMKEGAVERIQVLSTMAHSSIAKAASIAGIGRKNIRSVAQEGDPLQIDLNALEREARREGSVSILAISAGEVNTGRFATNSWEQMHKIRRICDELGVWIHVDGAFGLFGRVLLGQSDGDEYRAIEDGIQGLEMADSITGDCHKLLNVPYDCGIFFTRHKHLSEAVFGNGNAAYLTSGMASASGDDIQSPMNVGIENSRRFRALPVYVTLMAYGRKGYMDMLSRQIGLARRITRYLLGDARFDVLPHAQNAEDMLARTFIVVLFRARNEDLNSNLVKRINATGKIYVTGTAWEGKPAARMAVSNWRVDVEHDGTLIEKVLNEVAQGY